MTYARACELLKVSDPKATERNAAYGRCRMATFTFRAPLRLKVAAKVLMDGAK